MLFSFPWSIYDLKNFVCPRRSIDTLPQELIDYIVDFLYDDEKTLKACFRTCRSFSIAARCHLFAELVIKSRSQLSALPALVFPFSLVKSIIFYGERKFAGSDLFEITCWSRFYNVTQLELVAILVDGCQPVYPFYHSFPRLECLRITRTAFCSLHVFLRILHSLPRLQELSLIGFYWTKDRADFETDIVPTKLALRSLRIHQVDVGPLFEALIGLHSSFELQNYISHLDRSASSAELRFIEMCPKLRDLCLSNFTLSQVNSLNLSCHSSVEQIMFPCVDQKKHTQPWFPSILLSIGSRLVRKITFVLQPVGPMDTSNMFQQFLQWDLIDGLLSEPKFSQLEDVIINLERGRGVGVEVHHEMKRLLPRLAAQNILRFCDR